MLDRGVVLSKLDELDGRLRELESVAPPTYDAYVADLKGRLASERILQVGVEILVDLGEAFVSGLRLGLPADERALARQLRDGGVLSDEDADMLRRMQGFRNVLVHRYGGLAHDQVFANLQRAGRDFRRLGNAFRTALDRVKS